MFDVIIYLDPDGRITRIEWKDAQLERNFGVIWSIYVGEVFSAVQAFVPGSAPDRLRWNDEDFTFYEFSLPDGGSALFMKRDDHVEYFLKAALDTFSESVQIYDHNAMAVYMNSAGLASLDFPQAEVKHKHVLELFEVEADYSTVLTALRTKSRVVNRFARYRTRSGVAMTAVNNAWPVFRDGKLLGIVDTEMNSAMLESKIKELSEIESALNSSRLQADPALANRLDDVPAESAAMRALVDRAFEAAGRSENILITGAHGTGKDMLANAIHMSGARRNREMLIMNCASIPVDMQEQMLFGAASDSGEAGGLFERASGGVLLLQSVESLSLRAQGALLKALQGGSPRRGGGDISAGPQIISATSDDLLELVESKQFRIDLYYRLSVYTLKIPPLVERAEDIEKLILGRIRYNVELAIFGNRFSDISPEALELMKAYAWPGNLKELNYAVDFAMSRGRGPAILVKDLPGFLTEKAAAADDPDEAFEPGNLKEAVERFELQYIQHTLHHFGGNISKSAAALGMKRQSLQYRLRKGKN